MCKQQPTAKTFNDHYEAYLTTSPKAEVALTVGIAVVVFAFYGLTSGEEGTSSSQGGSHPWLPLLASLAMSLIAGLTLGVILYRVFDFCLGGLFGRHTNEQFTTNLLNRIDARCDGKLDRERSLQIGRAVSHEGEPIEAVNDEGAWQFPTPIILPLIFLALSAICLIFVSRVSNPSATSPETTQPSSNSNSGGQLSEQSGTATEQAVWSGFEKMKDAANGIKSLKAMLNFDDKDIPSVDDLNRALDSWFTRAEEYAKNINDTGPTTGPSLVVKAPLLSDAGLVSSAMDKWIIAVADEQQFPPDPASQPALTSARAGELISRAREFKNRASELRKNLESSIDILSLIKAYRDRLPEQKGNQAGLDVSKKFPLFQKVAASTDVRVAGLQTINSVYDLLLPPTDDFLALVGAMESDARERLLESRRQLAEAVVFEICLNCLTTYDPAQNDNKKLSDLKALIGPVKGPTPDLFNAFGDDPDNSNPIANVVAELREGLVDLVYFRHYGGSGTPANTLKYRILTPEQRSRYYTVFLALWNGMPKGEPPGNLPKPPGADGENGGHGGTQGEGGGEQPAAN